MPCVDVRALPVWPETPADKPRLSDPVTIKAAIAYWTAIAERAELGEDDARANVARCLIESLSSHLSRT